MNGRITLGHFDIVKLASKRDRGENVSVGSMRDQAREGNNVRSGRAASEHLFLGGYFRGMGDINVPPDSSWFWTGIQM